MGGARHGAGKLFSALDAGGRFWLLTNRDEAGLRSRPVAVWWDGNADQPVVYVLTGSDARKAAELVRRPEVSLGGPLPDGWLAARGDADVIRDRGVVEEILGRVAPTVPTAGVAVLQITVTRARRWTVNPADPYDNEATELID